MNIIVIWGILVMILLLCVISLLIAIQLERHGAIKRKKRYQCFSNIEVFLDEETAMDQAEYIQSHVTDQGTLLLYDKFFKFVDVQVAYDEHNGIYAVKTILRKIGE